MLTEPAVRVREVRRGIVDVVELAPDRVQVLDRRGRILAGFATKAEAEAWASGYGSGRLDAAEVARGTLAGLLDRIAGA